MKWPLLFRRDRTIIQRTDARDQTERILAESLRMVGQVCTKVADLIEAQRLQRAGYAHNTLLHRVDTPASEPKKQ